MNFETLGGDDSGSAALIPVNKMGLAISGVVSIALHEFIAFQPELMYTSKGTAYEFVGETTHWYRLRYLELPLLVRGRIPLGERVTSYVGRWVEPYVLVGPQLSVMLDAEVDSVNSEPRNVKDVTSSIDVGLCFGAGVAVALPWKGRVTLEGRYDMGFLSIDGTDGNADIKNRVASIMIGYQVPLPFSPKPAARRPVQQQEPDKDATPPGPLDEAAPGPTEEAAEPEDASGATADEPIDD